MGTVYGQVGTVYWQTCMLAKGKHNKAACSETPRLAFKWLIHMWLPKKPTKVKPPHWQGLVHSGYFNLITNYVHPPLLFPSVPFWQPHWNIPFPEFIRNKDIWVTFERQYITNGVANWCEERYILNCKISKVLLLDFRFTDPSNHFPIFFPVSSLRCVLK